MRDFSRYCYFSELGDDSGFDEYFGEEPDPCLIYLYENDNRICTLCKFGAMRTFFQWNDEYYVWCGKRIAVEVEENNW